MSDESASGALQRLARDLRGIREQRDISISALQEAIRVPESRIREFEEGTLYEQSRMNAVHLKAFVRAYAKTLDIPSDPVAEQLEAALEGHYENQLAIQFLNAPSDAGDQEPPESGPSARANQEGDSNPAGDSTDAPPSTSQDEAAGEKTPAGSQSERVAAPSDVDDEGETRTVQDDPLSSSTSPTRPEGSPPGRGAPASPPVESNAQRVWNRYGEMIASTALVLFVLALGIGGASVYLGGQGAAETSPQPTGSAARSGGAAAPDTNGSPDTTETDAAETGAASLSQSRRAPADVKLGDTLYLAVKATSTVAGMRVQQDADLRRPYWIEPGDAQVFSFTRRITVENQLDSLRLFLGSYSYPTTRTDEQGRVIISRDTAEQFIDTLRGAPASFPSPSDTVQAGRPPGSEADTLAQTP